MDNSKKYNTIRYSQPLTSREVTQVRIAVLLTVVLVSVVSTIAQDTDRPMLISRVALNQTQIAFTFAGKIWLGGRHAVPRSV